MRTVFMGTPEFAAASLDALLRAGHEIAAVVTAPDRPAGRGQKLQESAVKQAAVRYGLPVLQPEKLKDTAFLDVLRGFHAELFVVVAFRMLPEQVWTMPPRGTINLHASLLPQYRGAAPINWAIINGETCSGTTVFFINRDIDHGHILSLREETITPDDTAGTLHDRLMNSGAAHLADVVSLIESGNCTATPQDNLPPNMTLHPAPKIYRDTCKINWNTNAQQLHNLVRGLSPHPAAWTTAITPKGDRLTLKIYESAVVPADVLPSAGTVSSDGSTYLHIAAADAWLALRNLQLEGKKRMDIRDFLRGTGVLSVEN